MITIKIPFLHHAIQLNLYKFRFRGGEIILKKFHLIEKFFFLLFYFKNIL